MDINANNAWPARVQHEMLSFNNQLWILGGFKPSGNSVVSVDDVWYSPNGINWTPGANVPGAPRASFVKVETEGSALNVAMNATSPTGPIPTGTNMFMARFDVSACTLSTINTVKLAMTSAPPQFISGKLEYVFIRDAVTGGFIGKSYGPYPNALNITVPLQAPITINPGQTIMFDVVVGMAGGASATVTTSVTALSGVIGGNGAVGGLPASSNAVSVY